MSRKLRSLRTDANLSEKKNMKKKIKFQIEDSFPIDAQESEFLYIDESQIPNSGKGLFTAIPIYKQEIISVFEGEKIGDFEADKRANNGNDAYFINMIDGSIMDSQNVECFAKYANDAKGLVKTKFVNNALITLDDEERVCIVANRDIKVGEEIFCSYGRRYWTKLKLN